jgi:hypothetical protein
MQRSGDLLPTKSENYALADSSYSIFIFHPLDSIIAYRLYFGTNGQAHFLTVHLFHQILLILKLGPVFTSHFNEIFWQFSRPITSYFSYCRLNVLLQDLPLSPFSLSINLQSTPPGFLLPPPFGATQFPGSHPFEA